ncbi:MAG: hypothetical protein V1872_00515 [bacterium]
MDKIKADLPNSQKKKNLVKLILLVSTILFIAAFFQKDKLQDNKDVLEQLYQEPIQTKVDVAPFEKRVNEITYTITPLYFYELYGMVVSYHHSKSWWDIYHYRMWKDFINIKDICVVWGDNIKTEVYKEMKFSSDPWTCFWKWPNQEIGAKFQSMCLSNNHLVSENKELNKEIMKVRKGDQIYLKGYLARYSHSNNSFYRGTSTVRTDTGNGACETIYLEDFRILKKANPQWRLVFSFTIYVIICCVIILIVIFFKEPPIID